MQPDDRQLDRLLAGGAPAGPELDALWSDLQLRMQAEGIKLGAPRAAWPWRRLGLLLAPALAAAGLMLWVVDLDPASERPALQARGPATESLSLETSCGAETSPCRVGAPIYLRLINGARAGDAVLVLETPDEAIPIRALRVKPGENPVLDVQLRPENADITGGLRLSMLFDPAPGEAPLEAPALAMARMQRSPTLERLRRRLVVRP